MLKTNSKYRYSFVCILLCFLGISCNDISHDGVYEEEAQLLELSNISFGISRGLISPDVNATPEELIYDWHLVIVDKKGKIEAVLDRTNFDDKLATDALPFEEEVVNLNRYSFDVAPEIYEGKKTIYAFANMSVPTAMSTVGKYIDETTALAMTTTVAGNGFVPSESKPRPMTNILHVVLTNELNQKVDIPVIRTLAKIEFNFSTLTDVPITVQSITMNHVTHNTTDNIYLFGNYDSSNLPLVPSTSSAGNYTYTVNKYVTTTSPQSQTIYVNESKKPDSEYVGFTLLTKRDDKESTEVRYALVELAPGLHRNDFVKIPVKMTDYEFNPRIDFYPPIGGYAKAEVSSEPGEVFYVKLTGGGQIILRPRLYNSATNTPISDDPYNRNPRLDITPIAPTTNVGDVLVSSLAGYQDRKSVV